MPRRRAPILAAVLTLLPAAARAGVTELASLSSTGQQADGYSQFVVISGDGRYVAFESVADNLAPIAASSVLNVFVRDRAAGTTVVANVATNGALADGGAGYPQISRNGRYVAFESDSTNLVPNDTNQSNDVFVRDLRAGTTVRASVGAKGQQADAYNLLKAISATGRYVVFVSDAPDLVQGAASGQNLYVRDLKAGTTTLENLDFKGKAAEGIYYEAAITPDGRYLTFSSSAWTLVRQHTTDMNIYRRDRHKGETVLVSVRPDGTGGHLPSWGPFISDDGGTVAFEGASDLIVGGHSPWAEAVARDMRTGRTELVSVTLDGREPDGNSNVQGLSADG